MEASWRNTAGTHREAAVEARRQRAVHKETRGRRRWDSQPPGGHCLGALLHPCCQLRIECQRVNSRALKRMIAERWRRLGKQEQWLWGTCPVSSVSLLHYLLLIYLTCCVGCWVRVLVLVGEARGGPSVARRLLLTGRTVHLPLLRQGGVGRSTGRIAGFGAAF